MCMCMGLRLGVNVAVMVVVEVGVQSRRWLMGMLIRLLVVRLVMRHNGRRM
jgi:hypothetical protein